MVALSGVNPVYGSSSQLNELVAERVQVVFETNRRIKKTLLKTASKPAFKQYFSASDDDSRAKYKRKFEKAIKQTQKYFDVKEMCLIDRSGKEISRVDAGRVSDELATDEHEAVFFEPGFQLKEGRSLISPIYFSPDSSSWVIAYVTPIYSQNSPVALLHFEHDLDYLQRKIIDGVVDEQFVVALSGDGWIIADSRDPIKFSKEANTGAEEAEDFFSKELFEGVSAQSILTALEAGEKIQGYDAAMKKVGQLTILALEPTL